MEKGSAVGVVLPVICSTCDMEAFKSVGRNLGVKPVALTCGPVDNPLLSSRLPMSVRVTLGTRRSQGLPL